jgi:microcystin degradation protein MlrC
VGETTLEGGDCTNLHAFAIVWESSVRSTKRYGSVTILFAAAFFLAPARAPAQEVVVGVNVVNPMRASVADQNTLLSQLKAAQVRVIRCGISHDDKGIDFAKRAAAQGIRIQLIVGPQYTPNAPSRPYQPDVFPAMWGRASALFCRSRALENRLSEAL